jgi:predicted RNase H-like HicB family nuclease
MKIRGYRIIVERLTEEDGGGYLALVPELPGCSTDRETAKRP